MHMRFVDDWCTTWLGGGRFPQVSINVPVHNCLQLPDVPGPNLCAINVPVRNRSPITLCLSAIAPRFPAWFPSLISHAARMRAM